MTLASCLLATDSKKMYTVKAATDFLTTGNSQMKTQQLSYFLTTEFEFKCLHYVV